MKPKMVQAAGCALQSKFSTGLCSIHTARPISNNHATHPGKARTSTSKIFQHGLLQTKLQYSMNAGVSLRLKPQHSRVCRAGKCIYKVTTHSARYKVDRNAFSVQPMTSGTNESGQLEHIKLIFNQDTSSQHTIRLTFSINGNLFLKKLKGDVRLGEVAEGCTTLLSRES